VTTGDVVVLDANILDGSSPQLAVEKHCCAKLARRVAHERRTPSLNNRWQIINGRYTESIEHGFDDTTKLVANVLPCNNAVETGVSAVNDAKDVC
jgi:hypothetical protein